MPYGNRTFQIDFDFIAHRLAIATGDGREAKIALEPRTVADFHREVMARLTELGIAVKIWTMPVEIPGAIPFETDRIHAAYDRDYANRFWRILVQPAEARWSEELGEFLLPYEAVRKAPSPDACLLEFLQSTYAAEADLAQWDRAALERHGKINARGER